jgi:ATP-dependent DNA helicase PIF1
LKKKPFGGKVVIFREDFCQILPVIIKGTHEEIIGTYLYRSTLWKHVRLIKLKTNMRFLCAVDDPDAAKQKKFAEWLLKIRESHIPTAINELDDNVIRLSNNIVLPSQNIDDLIHFVYPDLSTNFNPKYLVEHAILAPKNDHVNTLNTTIMDQFSGAQ